MLEFMKLVMRMIVDIFIKRILPKITKITWNAKTKKIMFLSDNVNLPTIGT